MTEIQTIYKEASKETVENLIVNSSKVNEKLYENIIEDLSLLHKQNADAPRLLRLAVELRIDVRFILIDLLISLRGCLNGTYTFEKCYHIKNLEGIRVEGCRLLLGYGEERKDAVWTKFGFELRQEYDRSVNSKKALLYEKLVAIYDMVSTKVSSMQTTYEERKSRNLTYHYDDDLYKVYKQLLRVKDKGENDSIKGVIPWMDALLWIQILCETVEKVEPSQGNTTSKETSFHHFDINVIQLNLFKQIVAEFSKNVQLKTILDKVLKNIDSVDWAAREKQKLGRLEDWLDGNFTKQNKPKTIKDIKDLMNVYLLVNMSFADMACVVRALVNAETQIEYPLIFRRLLVSKVATLGHLVGYNDAEKGNAIWTIIQKSVPTDASNLKTEAAEIRKELEHLIKYEDVKQRGLYVHYFDRNASVSNVPRILENVEEIDALSEIRDNSTFIRIIGRILTFLLTLMTEFSIREVMATKASNIKMRSKVKRYRRLLSNAKCPIELRRSLNTTLDQIEQFF